MTRSACWSKLPCWGGSVCVMAAPDIKSVVYPVEAAA